MTLSNDEVFAGVLKSGFGTKRTCRSRRSMSAFGGKAEHLMLTSGFSAFAEEARGIAPRASHRTGLDALASSGSCHRASLPPSLGHGGPPVAGCPAPMAIARSLRSTGITPFHHYYGAVRP